MANLEETAKWEEGVYQWETDDPVVGGPDGIDNVPTRQLANRTGYLKTQIETHAAATDPHPQYLRQSEGDALYDKTGTAAASMAGHLAETDPHQQYTTDAEVAALLQKGLPMVSTTAQQFDNSTKTATTAFVQRALGNLNGAVQLAVNATTTLTAAQAGGLWQVQAGTVNLPASAGMAPGATYTLWSSGDTTVAANGTDKIYVANNGVSSFKMGANDFVTLVWQQAGVWAVTSGSSVLGYTAAFGSLRSANGYQKLPSELIIQWGYMQVYAGVNIVTYPIAFPNNSIGYTVCSANGDSTASAVSIAAVSATPKTTLRIRSESAGGVFWIVIGF